MADDDIPDDEISPGGSQILRHVSGPKDFSWPDGAGENFDELSNHLLKFLGPSFTVLHEIISDKIHLDVIVFPPHADRRWWTFVTSGMSDLPMAAPDDVPDSDEMQFAEIVISLPEDWFKADENGLIGDEQMNDERKYWPIGLIKFLARFPHQYNTWIWLSHSIPNFDPPEPYADNTAFNGVVFLLPITWDEDQWTMTREDGTLVTFMAAIPLYQDEMNYKLNHGPEALFEKLERAGVNEIVNLARPSAVARRGFMNMFRN